MTKRRSLFFMATILGMTPIHAAFAADMIPFIDLPPGTIGSGGGGTLAGLDANILAAVIGVVGLLIGSFLTILGTYFLRFLDVRRENRREELFMVRERKEKEFQIKQEIYKNFLTDLGLMEGVLLQKASDENMKDVDTLNAQWTTMEIKMNLVCSAKIRTLLDEVQEEILKIGEKRFSGGKAHLTPSYLAKRGDLLDAIREDIDLFQRK